MTKTTKIIMIAVVTTTLFSSCTPVSAREITSVNRTETGTLYGFSDGTGYYHEKNEIPELSNVNGLYPLTGIVTEIKYDIEPEVDLVTITCSNGNKFSWYADSSDCWMLNDLASCIMDNKGTEYVTDDEVLLAHYAGVLEHFEKYTVK